MKKYLKKLLAKIEAYIDKKLKPKPKPPAPPADPEAPPEVPVDGEFPAGLIWLHTNVSLWEKTATLNASVDGRNINLHYDKAGVWPVVDGVNANPWAIVNYGGHWYAATWEWLRGGQQSKPVGVLDGSKGDHFKRAPLSFWRPKSGERFGIMVSGLARSNVRNVRERSNVSWVVWP